MSRQAAEQVKSVVCCDSEDEHSWDHFLSRCTVAHVEQTSAWGRLKQIYGWKPTRCWTTRGETILGGAMILTRRISPFATIGYIERGPVWDPSEPGSMNLVTNALSDVAKSMRLAYLV